MPATYVQPTLQEFKDALGEDFVTIQLPKTKEIVLAKRVDIGGDAGVDRVALSLRVYTSLDPNGLGWDCGKDAIRVEVFTRLADGTIKRVGGSKRVNRTEGWQQRLLERIDGWKNQLGPSCPQCGLPMVERKSKGGKFYGCCSYPQCRGTRNV